MGLKSLFRRKKTGTGLALGGGGVRGIAHVPMLQVLDEEGIRPDIISGTSMGAILGALYASGRSGESIREVIEKNTLSGEHGLKEVFEKKNAILRWLKAVKVSWSGKGMLNADGFISDLMEEINVGTFEELEIPLVVIATDFNSGEEVIFRSGDLLPALRASMSIPGVFEPVEYQGRVLVDGGIVNNLPVNHLSECAAVIAMDVIPEPNPGDTDPPGMLEATLGMFDILLRKITRDSLEKYPPTLYWNPCLEEVGTLEFDKTHEVLKHAQERAEGFRKKLRSSLPTG